VNQSKDHHYLPQFYLKGFANTDGQFYIYDCIRKRIKSGTYYPASHFYEPKRNTVSFKGTENDLVEQAYSVKDNRHSKLLKFIQSCEKPPDLTREQLTVLQEFVADLFWRIPRTDEYYKNEFSKNPLFTKTFRIQNVNTGQVIDDEISRKLLSSEAFIKSVRVMAYATSILASDKSFDFHNWRITYSPNGFNFCSDNPIIFKDDSAKDIFDTDFIIPLTKSHLLIRTLNTKPIESTPTEFSAMIHSLVLKQGQRYCACSRRDYLDSIGNISEKFSDHILKSRIFSYLE
jgi:hypothetical protein